jgi:hypothetical protein
MNNGFVAYSSHLTVAATLIQSAAAMTAATASTSQAALVS